MSWKNKYQYLYGPRESRQHIDSFGANESCFIRKEHRCGKFFGASKSCFIACPTDDDLEPILELISEKLTKVGIEPIIAVKERAYGQDIFCTKICGKIIESKFCIVILDDTLKDGKSIPNPNVYYEYGLMTSLKKHIIPLQREKLNLAFNIQSYDTIKYNNRNIGTELDRAIKEAIRITEQKTDDASNSNLDDKSILRRFELAGFSLKDDNWFLSNLIEDTSFKGYGQHEKGLYLYLGKADEEDEFVSYLEDLDVIIYRTEKKFIELEDELKSVVSRIKKAKEKNKKQVQNEVIITERGGRIVSRNYLPELTSQENDLKGKISLMQNFYIGFIIKTGIDGTEFIKKAKSIIDKSGQFNLIHNDNNEIEIDGINISLKMTN